MFQEIHKLFNGVPDVFCIADDILIVEFDDLCCEHDTTLDKVLRICTQGNLKLNKDKCLFRCINIPFFSEVICARVSAQIPGRYKH